ncbi:hypothetical protein Btru_043406 [Bulinus truncatus]|nr:hypothetical protein Btru_043406 [Bulinus truncatus]
MPHRLVVKYIDPASPSKELTESVKISFNTCHIQPENAERNMQPGNLRFEQHRLRTFANYPLLAPKSPVLLAESGFVYTGKDDAVTCVFCHVVKKSWSLEDCILEVHATISPGCPLVNGIRCGNVPLTYNQSFTFQEVLEKLRSNEEENVGSFHAGNLETSLQSNLEPSLQTGETVTSFQQRENQQLTDLSSQTNTVSNQPASAARDLLQVPSEANTSQAQSSNINTVNNFPHSSADFQNTANQNTSSNSNGPTYSELGIVTDRPKRPEYALRSERLKTFSSWPRGHHIQSSVLADAGFYYAGYGDCARCFYCGGGLRNWEDDDDVWVEHARWFARCSFIRQRLGQIFVDTVQELNKTLEKIPYSAVINKIGPFALTYQIDIKDDILKKDPAIKTVVELGIPQKSALEMAKIIKSEENITQLKESNNILRQQTVCKICMDKEVEIVFLPCGHLVSCAECASAMKDCPVCRKHIKGSVRAFIS